jgi:hypothetical protein
VKTVSYVCLARIKSAFEMNNIQRGHVTCYMEDISLLRSFGEGQPFLRMAPHDSGPMWVAVPHSYDFCIHYTSPV